MSNDTNPSECDGCYKVRCWDCTVANGEEPKKDVPKETTAHAVCSSVLLSCLFCKGTELYIHIHGYADKANRWVQCKTCGACGPVADNSAKAGELWNTPAR